MKPRHLAHPLRRPSAVLGLPAAVLAAALLAAAGGAQAAKPAAAETSDKASPAWQTAAAKHNGSGVTVRYAVPDKAAVGETVTVRLAFSDVTAADGATVEVRDTASRALLLTLRLARGEERSVDLPFTGRGDGMQFVSITTTQGGRSTVQQVPVRVGSGELRTKPEGERRTTATGEAVISLPAATSASGSGR